VRAGKTRNREERVSYEGQGFERERISEFAKVVTQDPKPSIELAIFQT